MDELSDLAGTAMQGVGGMIENEASDIVGTVTHGGAAVGDALTGDFGGAAGEALQAGEHALGAATFGMTDGLSDGLNDLLGVGGDSSGQGGDLPLGEIDPTGDLGDGYPGGTSDDGDPGMGGSTDPAGDDGGYGGGDDGSYDPLPDPSGMDM